MANESIWILTAENFYAWIWYILYKRFLNFNNILIKHDSHDYIDKIYNQQNVYKSCYKVFTACYIINYNIYLK